MKEASYYKKLDANKVQCLLCPHLCVLKKGQSGSCKVRTNVGGSLLADTYGQVSALGFDPIEKKPLYHFFPGRQILSVGTVGCNLHCQFCQNCEISQVSVTESNHLKKISVDNIVIKAMQRNNNVGIAFTYNEPIVWYEFMEDIAKKAKEAGLKTVMVSNGFINPEPLQELLPLIDAFNIDLKAFNERFFKRLTKSTLEPVKENLKVIAQSDSHLEVTNLLIPGHNDSVKDFGAMIDWIASELGLDVPLHLSRYFPRYRLTSGSTAISLMHEYFEFASQKLKYVYLGNLAGEIGSHTYCPECQQKAISRSGYSTTLPGLDAKGRCTNCDFQVIKTSRI